MVVQRNVVQQQVGKWFGQHQAWHEKYRSFHWSSLKTFQGFQREKKKQKKNVKRWEECDLWFAKKTTASVVQLFESGAFKNLRGEERESGFLHWSGDTVQGGRLEILQRFTGACLSKIERRHLFSWWVLGWGGRLDCGSALKALKSIAARFLNSTNTGCFTGRAGKAYWQYSCGPRSMCSLQT